MKRVLFGVLTLLLSSCWRIPTDVNFDTDPRVLRGTWAGTLEKRCNTYTPEGILSPNGARWFSQSVSQIRMYDSITGNQLATYELSNATSKIAWSADSNSLVYLRGQLSLTRVLADPITGADISSVTLNNEMTSANGWYNSDLSRKVEYGISNITGTARLFLYNALTGTLIKTVVIPKFFNNSYALSGILSDDGTKFAFTLSISNAGPLSQVWVVDLTKETTTKVLEGDFANPKLSFAASGKLNFSHSFYVPYITRTKVKRVDLSTLQITEYTLGDQYNTFGSIFNKNGDRVGYVTNDIFYLKNLDTGQVLWQKTLESNNPLTGGSSRIYSTSDDGNSWLLSGAGVGCTYRVLDSTQQKILGIAAFEPVDAQPIQFTWTPTYRDSSSYTVSGKIKIGNEPERNLIGLISVPNNCSLFGGDCERLVKTSLPPFYTFVYDGIHSAQFEYDNGVPLSFNSVVIGRRKNSQSAQMLAFSYQNGSEYVLVANPTSAP